MRYSSRRPVTARSHNVGDVGAVAGMALRWRGWSHRADGDGGDRPHWLDVTAQSCAGAE
jgi:hypothetical protein